MVDNQFDNIYSWISTDEGLQKCRAVFDCLMINCSPRTENIISKMVGAEEQTTQFFKDFIRLTAFSLYRVPGCGRKSREEILMIVRSLTTSLFREMPIEYNVTEEEVPEPSIDIDYSSFNLQDLLPQIKEAFSKYPIRVNHALGALLLSCEGSVEKFYDYITDEGFEYQKIRNIGKKSFQDVEKCLKDVRLLVQNYRPVEHPNIDAQSDITSISEDAVAPSLPWYIEKLHPLLLQKFGCLSVRSRHALEAMYRECNQSVKEFYEIISDPDFSIISLHNIGKGSVSEISGVLSEIKSLVEEYSQADSGGALDAMLYDKRLSEIVSSAESRQRIISFEKAEGYFPFFLAMKEIIDNNFSDREHAIIEGMLRYREGQVLYDKDEIMARLSITRERARQIRVNIIKKLEASFMALHRFYPEERCHYVCLMHRVNEEINAKEDTSFSLDFVHWMIGSIFDEYEYEGNPEWTITTAFVNKAGFVALVPSNLVEYFDFKGFINDLNDLLKEKRQDDTGISLRNLIVPHIRVKYYDEIFPDIEKACRSIIYLHYSLDIDYGIITFKANSYKPLPDIIYDLILKNHAPMTVQDLIEAIEYNYPERDFNPDIIGANALRHAGIVPMGRTGKYTLKEWCVGSIRGGTIREFVCEYLDSLETPIASATDVGEYVRRFRPESTDTSISSNLIQERSRKFAIFLRDDVRYFGYSDREYDPCFKLISGDRARKRSTDVSMRLLEDFIVENGRYPCYCSDEEETRLCRFVGVRRSYYSKGTMTELEAEQWRAFEEKYGKYDIPNKRKRRARQQIEIQTDV